VIFEWDDQKSKANQKKHGVSFQEALTVFSDPLSITVIDPEHSETEYRFIDIGLAESGRVLVVSYTERGTHIRIISSRPALPAERRIYEEGD
jgi:uncharacterized protein